MGKCDREVLAGMTAWQSVAVMGECMSSLTSAVWRFQLRKPARLMRKKAMKASLKRKAEGELTEAKAWKSGMDDEVGEGAGVSGKEEKRRWKQSYPEK
jgi:hypothetical protein